MVDALLGAACSDDERAAAWIAKANAALMAADHAAGIEAAQQARTLAQRLQSRWLDVEAACLHAVGLSQAGRPAEALAIIEPHRALVEREGDARLRGRFWADYAYALNAVRRLRDAAFALQQAIDNAQALGDLAELATLTSNLATVKGNLGRYDEALALAHRALALQTELGAVDGPEGGVVRTYVGLYCSAAGRYREALEHLDAAIDCFTRDKQAMWIALASNHKAQVLIDLGQFARARQTLAYEPSPVRVVQARGVAVAARLERLLGHPAGPQLSHALASLQPGDLYYAEAWWIAAQVFEANGDGDHQLLALARGAQWVRRVALPNVPDEFRDSFLLRNPVNRALLAAADRASR
jgi:tetratricopeptide (TPR) repeat protein